MTQYAFDPNRRVRRYFVVELRPVDVPKFLQDNKGTVREVHDDVYRNAKEVSR